MVRYSGFLANRKRGSQLPKVYDALEMTVREKPKLPGFALLMKGLLGTDPYQCILCKGVVCGRGRNPTLRLWPTIFSGKIDVFPGDRRSRLISSMTSVAPA